MTPARHNIVHVSKQLGIHTIVDCYPNGTLVTTADPSGAIVAHLFSNYAGMDEVRLKLIELSRGVRAGRDFKPKAAPHKLAVRPEHRASRASLAKLDELCSGDDGVYAELDAPDTPATIIHELSLIRELELVLHPDGRVTWQRMGSDE